MSLCFFQARSAPEKATRRINPEAKLKDRIKALRRGRLSAD
jgi:hypothetical protein